jgi:hypothetical protein
MTKLPNPYATLLEYSPDHFYGHERTLKLLLEAVSGHPNPRHSELRGLSLMGKSAMLRYIADPAGALARHEKFLHASFRVEGTRRLLPVLVDFQALDLLPERTHPFVYMYARLRETCEETTRSGRPSLPDLSPPGSPPTDAAAAISRMKLDLIRLEESGVRVVLLLDDFDVAFERIKVTEAQLLRPWRELVAFVLTSGRRLEEVNPEAGGSLFYQLLLPVTVGILDDASAKALIKEPAKSAGVRFPPEDVQQLLKISGNHPYLLILAGIALWQMREDYDLLRRPETPLPEKLLTSLYYSLRRDFFRTFDLYWEHLSGEEKAVLTTLADGGSPDVHLKEAASSLLDKGLIVYDLDSDNYRPFSEVLGEYVKSKSEATSPAKVTAPNFTSLESSLYEYLRGRPEKVCTFDDLLADVWRVEDDGVAEGAEQLRRKMQVTISRLRKKLKDLTGEDITNVRDEGYRFRPALRAG